MAEPENQTPHILREMRTTLQAPDRKTSAGLEAVDGRFGQIEARLGNIWPALNGESILGRHAVADVDGRLAAIEKRLSALERPD